MAYELVKVSLLLLFFNNVAASYWNREFVTGSGCKKYFLSTLPYLNDMEIPSVVWDMPLCDSECLEKERHVLLDLYRSLGGKNWIRKWDIDANGTASNTSFHCDWHGILCDSNTRHIMNIYLSYNNVHGELHVNLSNVHYLLSFSIGYNAVHRRFENIVASMPKYLVKLEM